MNSFSFIFRHGHGKNQRIKWLILYLSSIVEKANTDDNKTDKTKDSLQQNHMLLDECLGLLSYTVCHSNTKEIF